MSKPLSAEALRLLNTAPRYARSKYVIPALFDGSQSMTKNTYWAGWKRILERAELPHCGTHAVRHRAADIANSGVPVKVGMALTAHKTVTMFMRYVHTEDDPIRAAAETVAARRRSVVLGALDEEFAVEEVAALTAASPIVNTTATVTSLRAGPVGLDQDRNGQLSSVSRSTGRKPTCSAEIFCPDRPSRGGAACLIAATRTRAGQRQRS